MDILEYWKLRNDSNQYSLKLNSSFKNTTKLIRNYPRIGRPTNKKNVRIVVVKDYLMIYEILDVHILIVALWGSRQDPDGLQRFLR
ncbi:type II toxin-antitoxin system RelE/ParE family toxin [Brumimicrobium glaciale]|nr:type II toxin-antitoxin system RelE/ParE family toxin [Brumimicrobium glaciale]